jgi:hypothetical protein
MNTSQNSGLNSAINAGAINAGVVAVEEEEVKKI